jgi:3-phenylpropionate/trans-cinnamate dioxygenase ferredoxin reductase component
MTPHMVVIGAGQAGLQAGETLRSEGFQGSITLFGNEPHIPYHRPPLSKAWLAGTLAPEQLAMRSGAVLERKKIALQTNATVGSIDVDTRSVVLESGERVPYSGLIIATGATPRTIPCSEGAQRHICTLRSRDDASALRERLLQCRQLALPLVVVGGGFIGLEVAATARQLGVEVTVLEAAPRLLERALSPDLSEWFASLHTRHGVGLVMGARIQHIACVGEDAVELQLEDGRRLTAGAVLVGIGVVPNIGLARNAGIQCEGGGIVVDEHCRTSIPHIAAAGDCTSRRTDQGQFVRLESVQNAMEQGRAAACMLLGLSRPFSGTPWFWSEQYDKKLQIAGLRGASNARVVRGDLNGHAFSIFHFNDARLVSVDSINSPAEHLLARKLIESGISPTQEQAADASADLASLLKAR